MQWILTRQDVKCRTWKNEITGEQFSIGGNEPLWRAAENAARHGRKEESDIIQSIIQDGYQ